jgi:hypothetical protein
VKAVKGVGLKEKYLQLPTRINLEKEKYINSDMFFPRHPQIICTTTRRIVPSFATQEIIPLIFEEALEVKVYFLVCYEIILKYFMYILEFRPVLCM